MAYIWNLRKSYQLLVIFKKRNNITIPSHKSCLLILSRNLSLHWKYTKKSQKLSLFIPDFIWQVKKNIVPNGTQRLVLFYLCRKFRNNCMGLDHEKKGRLCSKFIVYMHSFIVDNNILTTSPYLFGDCLLSRENTWYLYLDTRFISMHSCTIWMM